MTGEIVVSGPDEGDQIGPFHHILQPEKRAYLNALAITGNRTRAAEYAGIDRTTPYKASWRDDEEFQEGVMMALEFSADLLEDEATRRASEGLKKYKFTKSGDPVLHPETGEPYYEHEYSDTLLIVLLKMRGRFVDKKDVRMSGLMAGLDLNQLPDAAVQRIAAGENPMAVLASMTPEGKPVRQIGPGSGDGSG